MPVIDIEKAKLHLRVDDDAGDDVNSKLLAAIDCAEQFLNRKIFVSEQEMSVAKSGIPSLIASADIVYEQEIANAALVSNDYANVLISSAENNKSDVLKKVRMISSSIVINESIEAGILLILGHLYENREDVLVGVTAVKLPKSSECLLMPYRIDMGV